VIGTATVAPAPAPALAHDDGLFVYRPWNSSAFALTIAILRVSVT